MEEKIKNCLIVIIILLIAIIILFIVAILDIPKFFSSEGEKDNSMIKYGLCRKECANFYPWVSGLGLRESCMLDCLDVYNIDSDEYLRWRLENPEYDEFLSEKLYTSEDNLLNLCLKEIPDPIKKSHEIDCSDKTAKQCLLLKEIADRAEANRNEMIEECYRKYPVK